MLPSRDTDLIQIVDSELADAVRRGGHQIACRPGCTPCCHGVFRISALDAERLRSGWRALQEASPDRASAILGRAATIVREFSSAFPGDAQTGLLHDAGADPEGELWDTFAELPETDGPCPVLNPETGRCELYETRPMTCRVFGPPIASGGGIGVCELCYQGASEDQLLAGLMQNEHEALEQELDDEVLEHAVEQNEQAGETIIAWALLKT